MAQYQALHSDFSTVQKLLDPLVSLTLPETAALRLLIVHSWRRLLFRHPDLPANFFPETWPGEACRVLFCDLMDRLFLPPLNEIESQF